MLTFLFALAAIWTLFWFVMLMLDWGDRTALTDSDALCSTCANKIKPGSASANNNNANASKGAAKNNADKPQASQQSAAEPASTQNVTNISEARAASERIVKKPVADKHDQVNVTPLFEKPEESDDLKTIKGIGVVMERTLNDLGITTFKQLAGFQQAEVKMVSDVLSESKAGFGDRIERDEWVDQAKDLVKKAG